MELAPCHSLGPRILRWLTDFLENVCTRAVETLTPTENFRKIYQEHLFNSCQLFDCMFSCYQQESRWSLDYRLDNRGVMVRFPSRTRYFSLFQNVQAPYGVHPLVFEIYFLEVKEPKREADHLHSSNVDITSEWNYTSTSTLYSLGTHRKTLTLPAIT